MNSSKQANLKDVSDQVNSVVINAEQESILARLLQKVTFHLYPAAVGTINRLLRNGAVSLAVELLLSLASQEY